MTHFPEIVMIVPKLPPAIDGIGDYGLNLAKQLYQDFGWKTHFIVGTPNEQGEPEGDCFRVTTVAARSQEAFLSVLPDRSHTVLLHYAGHGYAKRGCPVWLVNALSQWCNAGGRLMTLFHELYATRPLLSSAILTSPFQKQLATQLMQLSDRVFTSRTQYAETIAHLSGHSNIPTLPVFSTVGELIEPIPLAQRSRQLIVFGGRAARSRVYLRSCSQLAKVCDQLNIESILDIGPKLEFEPKPIAGVMFKALGVQSASEISQYLSHAIAGFVDYPIAYLEKSTIFAAYCSHGMIPIVSSADPSNPVKSSAPHHYGLADHPLQIGQLQTIADAAHAWYQPHCLKNQSAIFAAHLVEG